MLSLNQPNPARRGPLRFALLALLPLALLPHLSACAEPGARARASKTPRESLASTYQGAPEWVTRGCRAYWTHRRENGSVSCASGTAFASRNPIASRETAIARARAALARNLEVTIESFARLEERGEKGRTEVELRSIVHQLTSASLPGAQLETIWQSETGEIHALVSLHVAKVQHSVRSIDTLTPALREDWALRATEAFERFSADQAKVILQAEQAEQAETPREEIE